MAQTYEISKDQINTEIERTEQEILSHLSANNFSEVSLAAKSHAIMDLELKFLIFGEKRSLIDEIKFLHDYYDKDNFLEKHVENSKIDISKRSLNTSQNEFLQKIRKELISVSGLFVGASNNSYEPAQKAQKIELLHLDEIGLKNFHEDHKLDILLYHYYLARYKEFLFEKETYVFDNKTTIKYSDYSAAAKQAHQRILLLSTNLTERVEQTTSRELLPILYEYIKSNRNELNILKKEVGTDDPFYTGAMSEFVKSATELLSISSKSIDKNLLLVPEQGLVTGNTLLDLCSAAFGILITLEMDEKTTTWFAEKKNDFENYLDEITSKPGCYIASMVYGDYNQPQVIRLRNFRDNHLNNNYFGRIFVRFYYRVSPKIVKSCENQKFIIRIFRKILDFIQKFI